MLYFVCKVEGAVVNEELLLGRGEYLEDELLDPFLCQYLAGRVLKVSIDAQFWRLSDLEVEVAGLGFDGGLEVFIQLRLVVGITGHANRLSLDHNN